MNATRMKYMAYDELKVVIEIMVNWLSKDMQSLYSDQGSNNTSDYNTFLSYQLLVIEAYVK